MNFCVYSYVMFYNSTKKPIKLSVKTMNFKSFTLSVACKAISYEEVQLSVLDRKTTISFKSSKVMKSDMNSEVNRVWCLIKNMSYSL